MAMGVLILVRDAAAIVGGNDCFAERRLMQPLLDCAQGIAPL
jgi:hypothetical protein